MTPIPINEIVGDASKTVVNQRQSDICCVLPFRIAIVTYSSESTRLSIGCKLYI